MKAKVLKHESVGASIACVYIYIHTHTFFIYELIISWLTINLWFYSRKASLIFLSSPSTETQKETKAKKKKKTNMMMFLAFSRSSLSLFFFVISIFSLSFWSFPTVVESHTAIDVCDSKHRPVSCPVKCFTTDPVCGMDGVTYWCGCDEARCAGATVAKKGFCQVGNNGGTASLSAQALLLVHIVWLIIIGISVLFGLF